jgi:hypothetical protein
MSGIFILDKIWAQDKTYTGCSKSRFTEKPNIKSTYLSSIVLQKLFKMCERVLVSSPTPALTQKHVSTRLNKFQLGLQFVTKQNYFFLLGKTTFGTHYILVGTLLG